MIRPPIRPRRAALRGLGCALLLASAAVACRRAPPPPPEKTDPPAAAQAGPSPVVTHRWTFDVERTRLRIVDVGMSFALDEALDRAGGELAINGGFFDREERPLGLAVSEGVVLSPYSPTMSGGVLSIRDGRATLVATEGYSLPSPPPTFAVQCRPRLLVAGRVNVRARDGDPRADRTALCLRDGGRTLDVLLSRDRTTRPTLHELASALRDLGCEEALNLDGGPSTGAAWRRAEERGAALPIGKVRHAVVLGRGD